MIRLTTDADPIVIDAEKIVAILPGDNGHSQLNMLSDVFYVRETPEEIARLVLDYRLAMIRYRVEFELNDAHHLRIQLESLAGCEQEVST